MEADRPDPTDLDDWIDAYIDKVYAWRSDDLWAEIVVECERMGYAWPVDCELGGEAGGA